MIEVPKGAARLLNLKPPVPAFGRTAPDKPD
jgi:hypothetical protein